MDDDFKIKTESYTGPGVLINSNFLNGLKVPGESIIKTIKILEKFCKYNSIGYIPLHDQLNKSRRKGIATHWKYDWHFNETGQRIFFESMFNYFKNIKN